MISTIRRSPRLVAKQTALDNKKYKEIENQIRIIGRPLLEKKSKICDCEKLDLIMDMLKLINKNASIFFQNSKNKKFVRFLEVINDNTPNWIKQTKKYGSEDLYQKILKEYIKFRKQYKSYTYAKWEYIADVYGLDMNLMTTIDSYM